MNLVLAAGLGWAGLGLGLGGGLGWGLAELGWVWATLKRKLVYSKMKGKFVFSKMEKCPPKRLSFRMATATSNFYLFLS